jgi:hypothetical protein
LLAAEIYEAELAVTVAKNALPGEGYAGTPTAAELRLGVLQNTYAMYCGPGGGPPPPSGSSGSSALGGLGPIVQVPPNAVDPAYGAGPPALGEEGSGANSVAAIPTSIRAAMHRLAPFQPI